MFRVKIYVYKLHLKSLLNIALTTQYPTFVVYQTNLKLILESVSIRVAAKKLDLNILFNIAQTTQYPTFVVYQTSFSRDSRQEVVWLYWLSRNMEEVHQHIHMDYKFVKALQMESRL